MSARRKVDVVIGSIKVPLVVLHHHCVQQRRASGVSCIAVIDVVVRGHRYGLYVVVLCEQEVQQDCAITSMLTTYSRTQDCANTTCDYNIQWYKTGLCNHHT